MINLLYFFRKKMGDPASSLYATKRWISSLPLKDEYQAHRMVVNALNLFNLSTEPLNNERLQVLRRLDDSSQALQYGLCRRYFENREIRHSVEQTLWKGVYALYWHMTQGYQRFIRNYLDDLGNCSIRKELPWVTARALYYCGMEIKWRYFHQEAIQPAMWKRLHKLYRLSESHGFAEQKVKIDVDGNTSTCMSIYMRILMLDMLTPTSLQPAQIEQVERWLMRWSNTMRFDNKLVLKKHSHCVDMANAAGAYKILPDMALDKPRYWDVQPFLDKLEHVAQALREGKPTDRLGIGSGCQGKACLELLEQMSRLWTRDAVARVYPRDAAEERAVHVLCGIEQILDSLGGIELNANNDTRDAYPVSWPLTNESNHGYGISLDAAACSHAMIGKLVGLRFVDDGQLLICALRWMSNVAQGQLSMGLEKLSDAPRIVTIQSLDTSQQQAAGVNENPLSALFLPNVDVAGMASSLILPAVEFATSRLLDLYDQNLIYKIRLTVVLEQSDDWVRGKFDILGRRSSAI